MYAQKDYVICFLVNNFVVLWPSASTFVHLVLTYSYICSFFIIMFIVTFRSPIMESVFCWFRVIRLNYISVVWFAHVKGFQAGCSLNGRHSPFRAKRVTHYLPSCGVATCVQSCPHCWSTFTQWIYSNNIRSDLFHENAQECTTFHFLYEY